MIKYLYQIIVLVIIVFPIGKAHAEGYELKVRIKNLENRQIILGHHFVDKLYPDDTLKLDNEGYGILQGKVKLPEGIYFLMTPSHAMFDFFMTENQQFSIETDSLNLLEEMKFEGSPENTSAWKYMKLIKLKQKDIADLQKKKEELTNENDIKSIDYQINKIGKDFKDEAQLVIDNNQNNFVGQFIKATQEIEIPEPPKDAEGKITDASFQLRYYRKHYFDSFDPSDARLLRTPIYEEKIKFYLDKVVSQSPDTVSIECDKLLALAEKDKEVFRYMLITLFNKYASSNIMGFDAVYAHIAEKWYIPKATFSDTAFINKTVEIVRKLKPLLIGKTAPDLKMLWVPSEHFIEAKTDTVARNNPNIGSFINLSEIKADYTILAFWESDCGHCKKTIPELFEVYKRLKNKGIEVMSVNELGGVGGKKKWIDFVNKHEMYDWLNVWNPYDVTYKKIYDISVTPTIYILDKDKKIIAKKLEPKQIEEFLNDLILVKKKE